MNFTNLLHISIIFSLVLILSSCKKEEEVTVSEPLFEILLSKSIPEFNADNAYEFIAKQVSFGPRNPGSAGHRQTLLFLQTELKKYADEVTLQNFSYTGYDGERLDLTNIIGKFNPGSKNRILFCAHWDTRPRAELDEDEGKRANPILGANDGASGVAVLLELARLLSENKPGYGIDIIFFDGEDYGHEGDLANYCLGSKYFALNLPAGYKPAFGILLDMVGDKEAKFFKEGYSVQYAPEIVDLVWSIANQLNAGMFINNSYGLIYDDHIPLNQAGLKTINIVDAQLIGHSTDIERRKYWHTHKDDLNNIGKETLQQVGEVITTLVYSINFNL